jgi:diguanylate cyclase (GGDEF)-like protein
MDPLTGIANRAGLQAAAAAAAAPGGRAWLGVVLVDLDGFKPVNDTHGHAAGDAVLVEVARRLAGIGPAGVRVAARLGGDEFAVLVGGLPAGERPAAVAVLAVAERVYAALVEPYVLPGGGSLRVGASVGAAVAPAGPDPTPALPGVLAAADLAMYGAKHAGGGVRLAPPVRESAVRADDAVPVPRQPANRLRDTSRPTAAGFAPHQGGPPGGPLRPAGAAPPG